MIVVGAGRLLLIRGTSSPHRFAQTECNSNYIRKQNDRRYDSGERKHPKVLTRRRCTSALAMGIQ